jgi:hypothetical protein
MRKAMNMDLIDDIFKTREAAERFIERTVAFLRRRRLKCNIIK